MDLVFLTAGTVGGVIELTSGQEIELAGKLRMGLGWDKAPGAGALSSGGARDADLDASAVQFGGDCQPLGGSFLTVGAFEWIFPTPFVKRGDDSTQFSAFVDVGNVFADYDDFDTGELRASAGLSFKWQAPVGPIIVNLATPLISEDGDRTETLQFAFGSAF